MRLKILNRWWLLCFVRKLSRARGECDPPDAPKKEIRIRERLKGEQKLEVIIHEHLHAAAWHVDEKFVKQFAEDLARNLTKLGYSDGKPD